MKKSEQIKLVDFRPTAAELKAVQGALRQGNLMSGNLVAAFEAALEAHLGLPVVCVSSGSAALHLACRAARIIYPDKAGIKFSVGSLGFIPSYDSVFSSGINIDYGGIFGSCRLLGSQLHGRATVADYAQALSLHFQPDRFTKAYTFSFNANKPLTTGQGGAVATADARIAALVRNMRNSGRDENGLVYAPGSNYRMSEPAAALGLEGLKRLPEIARVRTENVARYNAVIDQRGHRVLQWAEHRAAEAVIPFMHPFVLREGIAPQIGKRMLAAVGLASRDITDWRLDMHPHYTKHCERYASNARQLYQHGSSMAALISSRVLLLPVHRHKMELSPAQAEALAKLAERGSG